MSLIIDEKHMINENIFKYEDKIKSPMGRFLDVTPTFVKYYHINNDDTTTDAGFKDVESIIGFRSPLRFNKIDDLPLYGIEQIVPQIEDGQMGLDISYSGEATIVPGTVKPLQNDFFVIPHLKDYYIFRVTEIINDNIMADNFFKINFQLEYIDRDKFIELEKQITGNFTCTLENIGTENKCIIETEDKLLIDKIDAMYDDIAKLYLTLFYSERYNCPLSDYDNGMKLYDPFLIEFMNKHELFNKKNNFKTVIFTDQVDDKLRKLKYEKSVYRFIERRDVNLVSNFPFITYNAMNNISSDFARWHDKTVYILDIPQGKFNGATTKEMFTDKFVTSIKINDETDSDYAELIQQFVRGMIHIKDIPLTLNESLLQLSTTLEMYFYVPIILYIIKTTVQEFITKKS